jgi:hypothetical protein
MINHFKYLLFILFSSFSFATTIHVATTGSDDTGDGTESSPYATIQKGINNLSSGDTIIVYDGNYNGAININTGDIVIKSQNGNQYTSLNTVIYLGNYDASIEGFEISLDPFFLGGNVGVHIDSGFLKFRDCDFSHFEAASGVFMFDNDYGNLIFNNVSMDSLTHSSTDFLNNRGYTKFANSILNNSLNGLFGAPTSYEGEIIFSNSFLSDDFFYNDCLIDSTFNSTILKGNIKYYATNSILFTGFSTTISEVSYCLTPEYIAGDGNITSDPFFCDPENDDYTLSENSPAVGSNSDGANIGFFAVGCGVYDAIYFVSNNGSDENGDGSITSPYFSIQTAIDIANDFDTVKVEDGIYMENIYLSKRVALIGESRGGTIIDASNSGRCVEIGNEASISSFTLTNGQAGGGAALLDQGGSLIDNLLIKNNKSTNVQYTPSGILVARYSEIKNCVFYQNEGWISGVESNGDVNISNCLFYENIPIEEDNGYLIYRVSGTTTLNGLTIVNNQMPNLFSNTNGGTLNDFYISNSIVNNNLSSAIEGNISVSYTNFQGGIDGDGNIDINPFFCDPFNDDYTLSENSPCVATGLEGVNMGAFGIACEALTESLTINEIMNNPSAVSDNDGEWFEIYNNGDVSHDLNGWTIKDNNASHIINNSILIHPGDYKIFSNNSDQNSNGGVVVDYEYGSLTLANSGDELVLIDPNGTVFDSVAYDGGPEFPDLNGASMGVVDSETDNNVGSNWQASTTAYGDGDLGTPGLPNFSSDIDVELTTIDFDNVLLGESLGKVLSIYNNGNTVLLIDSVYTSSDLFTLPFTESSIDDSLELTITFTPLEYGIVEDTLFIVTNDPDEGHLEIPLIAFGYIPSPNIVLETTSIDFGTVMDGLTETFNLKVRNTGDVELEIDTIYISGHDAYALGDYSNNIEAGDSSNIPIIFSPDDEANFEATLNIIILNDPDVDSLGIPLNGVGGEPGPILVLSKDQIDFGIDLPTQDTLSQYITIHNRGVIPLEVEEIEFDTNIVWSDFSDISLAPQDSLIVEIHLYLEDALNFLRTKMNVISNDYVAEVPIIAGYFLKLDNINCSSNQNCGITVYINSPEPFFGVQLQITSNPPFLTASSVESNELLDLSGWSLSSQEVDNVFTFMMFDNTLANPLPPGEHYLGEISYQTLPLASDMIVDLVISEIIVNDAYGQPLYNDDIPVIRNGSVNIYTADPAPTGLAVMFNNGIHLTWNENVDDDFSHFVLDKSYGSQFQTNDYTSIMVYENFYSDTSFSNGQTIYYRLSSIDSSGYVSDFTEIVSIEINLNVVDGAMTPEVYALHQNYPNPFNPTTKISYDLPEASVVSLSIYNIMGREIRTMINSEQTAGFKNIQWNATDNLGKSVPAGMYIYTIQAGEFRQTRKMVLLK